MADDPVVIDSIEVRGSSYPVHIVHHLFVTILDTVRIEAGSWESLYTKLMEATKIPQGAASIPVVTMDRWSSTAPSRGNATGIHGASDRPMITWSSGKRGQATGTLYDGIILTDEILATHGALMAEAQRLSQEAADLVRPAELSDAELRTRIRAAAAASAPVPA